MSKINEKKAPIITSNTEKIKPKNKRTFLIVVIIVILIATGIWFWYLNLYGYITIEDAYIDRDKATISAKILGRISKIYVEEGLNVKKGQPLVELDASEISAQERQAEASYIYAKESVNLSKVNLDKIKEDFTRTEALYNSQTISAEEYSHAKKSVESAEVAYKMAQNQVEVAKAQVELLKTNLKNTIITSAFDGVVAKKWSMEGDVVQPAQPILTINSTEKLSVLANFEETHLSYLHINEEVTFIVDAYHNINFKGKITQIGSSTAGQFSLIPPNNASGNFTKITQRVPVKISVEQTKNFDLNNLIPGMSVVVKVKKRG